MGTRSVNDYVLEDQIGHLLRRAHQRATGIFQSEIGDAQVTPTQFAALVKLAEDGEVSQNRLGRLTAMDPATIQGVVRRLAGRGLVEQRADPDDRRRTLLRLTLEGRTLVDGLLPNGPRVSAVTLEPLDEGEQATLLRLLRRLT